MSALFFTFIAAELLWIVLKNGSIHGRYDISDSITSVGAGLVERCIRVVLGPGLAFAAYSWLYNKVPINSLPAFEKNSYLHDWCENQKWHRICLYNPLSWFQIHIVALPWDSVWTWLLCFLVNDFCYYLFHRFAHEINFFWCADP